MKLTKSIIIGTFIALTATATAQSEDKPFIKKDAKEATENNGYVHLPVAVSKKKELQGKLDKYMAINKLDDLQGHILQIQALLAEKYTHGSSMVIEIVAQGKGESQTSCTITYTEDGWMDHSTRGQRYQYEVKIDGKKLKLHRADAWMQLWSDNIESTRKYFVENNIKWGGKE